MNGTIEDTVTVRALASGQFRAIGSAVLEADAPAPDPPKTDPPDPEASDKSDSRPRRRWIHPLGLPVRHLRFRVLPADIAATEPERLEPLLDPLPFYYPLLAVVCKLPGRVFGKSVLLWDIHSGRPVRSLIPVRADCAFAPRLFELSAAACGLLSEVMRGDVVIDVEEDEAPTVVFEELAAAGVLCPGEDGFSFVPDAATLHPVRLPQFDDRSRTSVANVRPVAGLVPKVRRLLQIAWGARIVEMFILAVPCYRTDDGRILSGLRRKETLSLPLAEPEREPGLARETHHRDNEKEPSPAAASLLERVA